MIDEDPGSSHPTYLKSLIAVEIKHDVRLLKDANRGHILIVIQPRPEEWILTLAAKQQVDVKQFGLPDKPERLHQLVTSRLDQFKRLIDHLLEQESEPIMYLKRLSNS